MTISDDQAIRALQTLHANRYDHTEEEWEQDIKAIRDALEAAQLGMMEPDGWKLVPVIPTDAMIKAGFAPKGMAIDGYANSHRLSDKWHAMLQAAPQPPK